MTFSPWTLAPPRGHFKFWGPFSSCIDLGQVSWTPDILQYTRRMKGRGSEDRHPPAAWNVPADIHVGEKPAYNDMSLEPNLVL